MNNSAHHTPNSAFCTPHSALRTPNSALRTPNSALCECPSCGNPLNGQIRCPNCGAGGVRRIKNIVFVIAAVVLLIIGIFYVLFAIYSIETPVSSIGALTEDSDQLHVRVQGIVDDIPYYSQDKYETSLQLKFYVNDTTGRLAVKVNEYSTKKLIENKMVPGLGLRVDVEGKFRFSTSPYILVTNPDFVKIPEPHYTPVNISELSKDKNGTKFSYATLVEVSGVVSSATELKDFAVIIDVRSGDSKVTIFVPDAVIKLSGRDNYTPPAKNLNVTVKGALEWYAEKSYWEIIPRLVTDIEIR